MKHPRTLIASVLFLLAVAPGCRECAKPETGSDEPAPAESAEPTARDLCALLTPAEVGSALGVPEAQASRAVSRPHEPPDWSGTCLLGGRDQPAIGLRGYKPENWAIQVEVARARDGYRELSGIGKAAYAESTEHGGVLLDGGMVYVELLGVQGRPGALESLLTSVAGRW